MSLGRDVWKLPATFRTETLSQYPKSILTKRTRLSQHRRLLARLPVGDEQENRLAQRRRGAENTFPRRENQIGTRVLEAAIHVHRELGPGLLETVYEVIAGSVNWPVYGMKSRRQVPVPILYKGNTFDEGFRADLIVEILVLLELKSIERILPVHKK